MENQDFQTKGTVVCRWCSYDQNPVRATHCRKCGKPLVIPALSSSDEIAKSTMFVAGVSILAIVLLLFSVGGYFVWQQIQPPTTTSDLNSSSTSSLSSSSDIQLYNSMKEVPNVPEGTFNYGGAVLFASITASGGHEAMTEAHPNFSLLFTEPRDGPPSQTKGIAMLLNGDLSFAQSAVSLKDADYSKAKERGFALEQVPVAIDTIVFFTHPNVSIPGLSVDQLQDIYKGKITNWKQVGGPDLLIVPFARDPKVVNLLNVLLGSEAKQVSSKVQLVRDYTEAIRKVASTPGGISFGGSGPLVGQKSIRFVPLAKAKTKEYVQPFLDNGKRLNTTALRDSTYPMTRRLFIVIRRDGKIDEQAGVAYTNMLLSKEGQQFVEKAGFLPLR
jgi:phosphate transport system substrate-binding protein